MVSPNTPTTQVDSAEGERDAATENSLVTEELLVEEISIDGMCGVY
jgi:mycofactocin precursor